MAISALEMTVILRYRLSGIEIIGVVKELAVRYGLNYQEEKSENGLIIPGAIFPFPKPIILLHVFNAQKGALVPDAQYPEIRLFLHCSERDINNYFLKGDENISQIVNEFKKLIKSIDAS